MVVSNTRPDIATASVLHRLDQALALIERFAPHRFERLKLDVTALLIRRFACRGAFYPDLRLCLVELTFLAHSDITPAQVAASIVHEGTHAELAAAAGLPLAPADEERRCRQAEIEFGMAIPDGAAVLARAREALGMADGDVAPTIDWSVARSRVNEADLGGLGSS